jgi:DNA repair protein RadD
VTGDTPKPQRARILAEFKTQRLKYVVNVSVLTTGFDAPHVDVVALLRRTESASLLQQIVGRGLRLFDGKQDCLLLDYAENLEYHAPDGDIFRPEIRVSKGASGDKLPVECPDCGFVNMFAVREDCKDIPCDKQGYALDLAGDRIYTESGQPMPVHYGRRCQGLVIVEGSAMQCGNFWSHKVCPDCKTDNDIAARKCRKCSAELIDPNEKLKLDFAQFKKDPSQRQCDRVLQCVVHEHISSNGNRGLKIQWVTPYRRFTTFHVPGYYWPFAGRGVDEMLTTFASKKPETITYRKEKSGYYAMLGLNQAEDVAP